MKKSLSLLFLCLHISFLGISQCDFRKIDSRWNAFYEKANTAKEANYLSEEEKNFYLYLNLLRINPSLFADTFLKKCTDWNNTNEVGYVVMFSSDMQNLYHQIKNLPAMPAVQPQEHACLLTECYAEEKTCEHLVSGGSSSEMFYENTGLRLLMAILRDNDEYKTLILGKQTTTWGIHIASTLRKDKATAVITKFSGKIVDIQKYEEEYKNKPVVSNPSTPAQPNTTDVADYVKEFQAIEPQWKDKKYIVANSAANTPYLNEQEKLVYYFLNLARMNPPLFAETFLIKYTKWNVHGFETLQFSNPYFASLYKKMKAMKSMGILIPDANLYESAKCHAFSSGKVGYAGHDRLANSGCKKGFYGECCSYGLDDALGIVMQLLIDEGVPSLGHRKICLSPSYKTLGVSIAPHKKYRFNAVLDFGY